MSAATKVQLNRQQMIALYKELGFKTADKWDGEMIVKKIAQIKDVKDPAATYTDDTAKLLIDIEAALESGAGFEVVGDSEAAVDTSNAGSVSSGNKKSAEEKAAEKAVKDKEKEEAKKKQEEEKEAAAQAKAKEKADKAAAKAKEKEEKEAAKAKEKADKAAAKAQKSGVHGVRPVRSRIYLAAGLWKKYGLSHGVTDELAAELDALCKDSNPKESLAWLKVAWHAVNGYLQEVPVEKEVAVTLLKSQLHL